MATLTDYALQQRLHQEEAFLQHALAKNFFTSPLDAAYGGAPCDTMAVGNIVPLTTPQVKFFHNYDHPAKAIEQMSQLRSTSMLHDFFTADLSKCSLNDLMAYSAITRMVAAEYRDYGLDVPHDITKRLSAIEREIQRAIEQQIEQLESEEKELQKREERRKDLRAQREKLQQALAQ